MNSKHSTAVATERSPRGTRIPEETGWAQGPPTRPGLPLTHHVGVCRPGRVWSQRVLSKRGPEQCGSQSRESRSEAGDTVGVPGPSLRRRSRCRERAAEARGPREPQGAAGPSLLAADPRRGLGAGVQRAELSYRAAVRQLPRRALARAQGRTAHAAHGPGLQLKDRRPGASGFSSGTHVVNGGGEPGP